jgi:hypothetical protein
MNSRPTTLREVAERSASVNGFRRHLRDWLQELRRVSSRLQASAAIAEEPARLAGQYPEGAAADAWLAAYAEHLADKAGIPAPAWALAPERTAPSPVFDAAADNPASLTLALNHSPQPFKQRNIFTPAVDLPLSLRAGRPVKSIEEKRRTNAARQQRFRAARLAELTTLRHAARQQPKQSASRLPLLPSPSSGLPTSTPPTEPDDSLANDLPSFLK